MWTTVAILILPNLFGCQCSTIKSVTLQLNEWTIHDGIADGFVAYGNFSNSYISTGWATLEVSTSEHHTDEHQAYAAGMIEADLTSHMINDQWYNTANSYCAGKEDFCGRLNKYLTANIEWMEKMFESANEDDVYWHQLKLLTIQTNGLIDGFFGKQAGPRTKIDAKDFFGLYLLQIQGDLEDLEPALASNVMSRPLGGGSCSALIKLLPEFSDVLVAHDTWNTFQSMIRILKRYSFKFRLSPASNERVPVETMTFSSYPGVLMSGDDFYVLSNRMVTQETTIGNTNPSLWEHVQPTNSVMEGYRSVLANRLATTGKDWARWFSRYNSGTYNNEWMIVDYRQFEPGHKPSEGFLTVLEQIPSYIHTEDLTELLIYQTYFPSYNLPYFEEVFNMSGVPALVDKYGDWFGYSTSPRGRIFRQRHSDVNDMQDMINLMRYNDFKNDPISRCNCTPPYSAENSIAARSDLNPANGTYPFAALGHRAHGAIDVKATNFYLSQSLQFISQAGPTFSQQPPFRWSSSDFTYPHRGHPDEFKYEPITHAWSEP